MTRESIIRKAVELLLQGVYPPACVCCQAPLLGEGRAFLCDECGGKLQLTGDGACWKCGAAPGEHSSLGEDCENCRKKDFRFTRACAVTGYGSPTRDLIHDFKFKGNRRLAEPLAAMMVKRTVEAEFPERFDCVVPVPLHPRRKSERGYNQAELLAKGIAKLLNLPLRGDILERIRDTEAQATLSHDLRITNPVGAFRAREKLRGGTVLLVDDVLTTGTTVSECAGSLRSVGANRIYVAVFAR